MKTAPNLICLAGAGGTGKTSIVTGLVELGWRNAILHASIVREFYATEKVSSEKAFLGLPPSRRLDFQIRLFKFYIEKLCECVTDNTVDVGSGGPQRTIICERSVFDHYAYTLYGTRELLTRETLSVMEECVEEFCDLNPSVFYLPYPTPWLLAGAGADGFRAQEPAKDTIVDAVIWKLLDRHRTVWKGTVPIAPLGERVDYIKSHT